MQQIESRVDAGWRSVHGLMYLTAVGAVESGLDYGSERKFRLPRDLRGGDPVS